MNSIPPLSVVNNPLVDTAARQQGKIIYPAIPEHSKPKFVGFKPGLYDHTWYADDNHVPCYDYHHQEFKRLNGHDFK